MPSDNRVPPRRKVHVDPETQNADTILAIKVASEAQTADGYWKEARDGTRYNSHSHFPFPVGAVSPTGAFVNAEHIVLEGGELQRWIDTTYRYIAYVHRADCFFPMIVPGRDADEDNELSGPVDLEYIIAVIVTNNPNVIGITCSEGYVLWCAGTDEARAIMKERANA